MLYSIFSQCLLLQVLAKGAWAEKDLCVFRELDFRCNKTFGILVHFVFSILYFTHKSNLWHSHTYMRERPLCLHLFILLYSAFMLLNKILFQTQFKGFPCRCFPRSWFLCIVPPHPKLWEHLRTPAGIQLPLLSGKTWRTTWKSQKRFEALNGRIIHVALPLLSFI